MAIMVCDDAWILDDDIGIPDAQRIGGGVDIAWCNDVVFSFLAQQSESGLYYHIRTTDGDGHLDVGNSKDFTSQGD